MKQITEKLKFELKKSHAGGFNTKIKWNDIFDTEEELIQALFNEKIYTDEDGLPMWKWCKGYDFIKGFRNYYRKNGNLTEGQIRQLKRLAAEMAYHIFCE